MTLDQVVFWLIVPAIATLAIGGGAIWWARHIP